MKPPKFPLPKGAKAIKPFRKAFGGWIEMEFDAKVVRLGLAWLRVKNGFGQRGDREDWVAAVPSGCLSVSRWEGEKWRNGGTEYRSFDAAIKAEVKRSTATVERKLRDLTKQMTAAKETLSMLDAANTKATTP